MDRSTSFNAPTSIPSPFSPLRNTFVDDYESGMEASASSMASGGDEEDEEEEDEFNRSSRSTQQTRDQEAFKRMHLLQSKRFAPKKAAMTSSGNSSTDSTVSAKKLFKAPLQSLPTTVRVLHACRKEDVITPSSGYDGDTEGPLNEDRSNKGVQ
jgi:hypothetical protein